jgi:hypothetical protein
MWKKILNMQILTGAISKKTIAFLCLFLILLFSLLIRLNTFWISHWAGDQCHYICLAMKLEQHGLNDYNIRGVDVSGLPLSQDKDNPLAIVFPTNAKKDDKGEILKARIMTGLTYYDIPLFQNAPGFPFLLMLSHKIFTTEKQPYTALSAFYPQANRFLIKFRPSVVFNAQFYAAVVPLVFSLATIALIFFIGSCLFSKRAGLSAAFIYAIDPVNLLTSQRIWADDMLSFFVTLSVGILILALLRQKPIIALFSGLACGCGILAKQTGLILIPAAWILTILLNKGKFRDTKGVFMAIFNAYITFFITGILLATGFWFYKVSSVYGTPFFTSERNLDAIATKDVTGWHKLVADRPHGYLLYLIGIPSLCPLFLFSFFSIKKSIKEVTDILFNKGSGFKLTILWLWVLAFYLSSFTIGKEHRYMMPMHPALALLSGYMLTGLRDIVKIETLKDVFILMILAGCAFWSVPIGLNAVINNQSLLLTPF